MIRDDPALDIDQNVHDFLLGNMESRIDGRFHEKQGDVTSLRFVDRHDLHRFG